MASKVYDTFEIELQDGTAVTVRPLPISLLRPFMDVVGRFAIDADGKPRLPENDNMLDEIGTLEILLDACAIALTKQVPDIAKNREKLEDALDLPTMWKIMEVAGGISMGNQGPVTAPDLGLT